MDINDDKILDLFICDAFGNLSYYTGTAVGSLEMNEPKKIYTSSGDYMPFFPHDWDGDGLVDILIMDRSLKLLKNIGTKSEPQFKTKNLPEISCFDQNGVNYSFTQSAYSDDRFNAGDFNNDGLMDIIVVKSVRADQKSETGGILYTASMEICLNSGTKTSPVFEQNYTLYDKTMTPLGYATDAPSRTVVADLNGDGALDIVAADNFSTPKSDLLVKTWALIFFEGIPGTTPIKDLSSSTRFNTSVLYNSIAKTISFNLAKKPECVSLYSLHGRQIKLISKENGMWQIPDNVSKGNYVIVGELDKNEKVYGKILK